MDIKSRRHREGQHRQQMDIKDRRYRTAHSERALASSRIGRLHIMQIMQETIARPRENMSKYAPKISLHPHPEKIREVIGPVARYLQIIAETGVKTTSRRRPGTTHSGRRRRRQGQEDHRRPRQ
jgi:polyribonucleotide nucleotidyltransferase